jgi:formate dehydrogenase beta subunit
MGENQSTIERSFARPVSGDVNLRPPCEVACPIHTDAQGYIQKVAEGHYDWALAIIRETNPLPQSIGRICAHPCEEKCRRRQVDEPIAICNLKRVASDGAKAGGLGYDPPQLEFGDKKVAIIGSGPSGLAAAHDLALLGIRSVIFERQPEPGGFLRTGILEYRLPKKILDEDIGYITGMGVEIKTGVSVGKDVAFDELAEEYDAVLIAVGLSMSRSLPIPGVDTEGVLLAVPFLEDVNAGRDVPLGENIIVVGGGNVAIDVARSARRVSGGKVTMVCLEADYEMPAHDWEIADARDEGIEIICSQGPKAILGEGKVEGLEVKKCEAVFDENGRFAPTFCETELSTISGDTVIIAIGQMSDLSFVKGHGPELDARGLLVFDRGRNATTMPNIFASGEVVTGPGAAVNALASGKRAAISIARYLGLTVEDFPEPESIGELPAAVRDEQIKKAPRRQMPVRNERERIEDFQEVELGLEQVDARCEASRCLLCGSGARYSQLKCISCLTCVRVCPYGAPWADKDGLGGIDPAACQACGICFTQCPAKAIDLNVVSEDDIKWSIEVAIEVASASKTGVIEFGCWYPQTRIEARAGAVMLPCTGRLSTGLSKVQRR